MDGENNGKPYEQMDDLFFFPLFLVQHPHLFYFYFCLTIGVSRLFLVNASRPEDGMLLREAMTDPLLTKQLWLEKFGEAKQIGTQNSSILPCFETKWMLGFLFFF